MAPVDRRKARFAGVCVAWLLALASGCGSNDAARAETGGTPDAGADAGGAGGGDGGPSDGAAPDAGNPTLEEIVRSGQASHREGPRPAFGSMVVANDGERTYLVESRRDVESGPFGLPWRSRFRVVAREAGQELWTHAAAPDDLIGDVVVHPSGEVTIAVQKHAPQRMAYELVRLASNGTVIGVTTLSEPTTPPESDYGTLDPRPLFRMKSELADATTAGWLRLLPDGEGIVAAFLSFVDVSDTSPLFNRLALGIATFDWESNAYVERWARIVEGVHAAQPAAWAYDELRWREQAMRPFLARDDSTGDLLVGRAWNRSRCEANVDAFAELPPEECVFGAVDIAENERLPLAVTRFDAGGARLGTRVIAPDEDAAEQVPFALAARDGKLAVVGAVVRELPDGTKRMYDGSFVDYDGYVAVYDAQAQLAFHHDFGLGRGDVLASMRWTADGIVGVGATGWDRWFGGMSISRSADPLFVWLSSDGTRAEARAVPLSSGSRHYNLHDLVVLDRAIVGYGFSDAPMTHSGDGGNTAARTFGPLEVRLSAP